MNNNIHYAPRQPPKSFVTPSFPNIVALLVTQAHVECRCSFYLYILHSGVNLIAGRIVSNFRVDFRLNASRL